MAVTLDPNLAGIFKTWYTDEKAQDVFFRNSPVVKKIKKTRIGGKQYNVPLLLGNGGGSSGNLLTSITNVTANGSAPNVEFQVTPGQIFTPFFVTQQEVLASINNKGAYVPVPVIKMAQALDSFRKCMAISLYGTGFGEIGQIGATPPTIAAAAGQTFITTDTSLVVKLSLGSVFSITNGATPSSALRTGKCTVTGIDGGDGSAGTVITFTSDTAIGTPAETDWICLDGCRQGSTPLLPVGLGGWLPSIANRTGGTWTSYIGTSFFGVTRNQNVNGAAGQFIKRNTGASEKKVDAIVRGVRAVRTNGGTPDILVLNDNDYVAITLEMNAQSTYFQNINTGSKVNKNEVAKGISDMKYALSTSWVDEVWDDPFCPVGTAYILTADSIEFAGLTNTEAPINDGITDNNVGKEGLTDYKAPELNYYWLIEDYITSQPGANTANGPALQVLVQVYGAWVVHNPSGCCVLNIA